MKIIDRRNQKKLYLQLVEIIQVAIETGELALNQQLPTEDELCLQQGVSKAVVRAAMQELARAGYIEKIPGKGTFVRKPATVDGVWLSVELSEQVLDFGLSWDTEVLQKMVTVAPSDITELFAMEAGNQVFKIMRVRSIKEVPIVLETAYVSHDLCPGLPVEDLRTSSLFDLIEKKHGLPITRCADSIGLTTLEDREAEFLKKDTGLHAVLSDRIVYTTNNRVVAFIRIISTSDDHRITYESVRHPGE
ncbi:UTRA domain-containing protein [bacterium]|nr:UTRA domain-containing protein [bacterium]